MPYGVLNFCHLYVNNRLDQIFFKIQTVNKKNKFVQLASSEIKK